MKKIMLIIIMSFLLSNSVFAGQWLLVPGTTNSWCYVQDDGTFAKNKWILFDTDGDGKLEYYYFNVDGFMLSNTTTPDGYEVNMSGAWVKGGIVQTEQNSQIDEKSNQTNVASSYEKKKELKKNIISKNNVDFVETIKMGSKNWVNAIRFSGNDSYIKASSGDFNSLSFEVGVKEINDEAEYLLTIYINNQEAEVIDEFSQDGEVITISIDPNSEVMLVYSCTTEDRKYLSSNQKSLYIRNANFQKVK